jgi:protein-tyrosine-phosphatase/predicted ATP-grasp superfamily ATP-dependent carboligase
MQKALVLDAFSPAGLETIQSLGRHGVVVHAACPHDRPAILSRYIARTWEQPPSTPTAAFLEWLRQLMVQNEYDLIVPSTEYSLLPLAELEDDDPLRAPIQVAPRASLWRALDKWSTLELARSCGVPTPRSRLHTSHSKLSPPESFPVVLKTARSVIPIGGAVQQMRAFLARDYSEWKRTLHSLLPLTPVVEQECLSGYGLGIELLYENGRMVWHFCHKRLHEGSGKGGLGGGSTYRCSEPAPPELLAYATAMLDRIRWHGVAMVEFLETPDGRYFLMEINPRLWGSLALAIDAGVDFPLGMLLLAIGQPIPPQPAYRVPYYARAFNADARWIFECLRSHPLTGLREIARLGRMLLGSESWDHFDRADLGVTTDALRKLLGAVSASITNRLRTAPGLRRAARLHRRNLARLRSRPQDARRVLFLCQGNICRSPLAERMARRIMPGWDFASAGFHPELGRPVPQVVQTIARSFEFDLSEAGSKEVTREAVDAADLVLVMDLGNLKTFTRLFPQARDKVLFLGMFAEPPGEIPDPYDANFQQTLMILQKIEMGIAGLAEAFGVQPAEHIVPAKLRASYRVPA